jgi:carbon-monoxide dehydrogenase medium subunit
MTRHRAPLESPLLTRQLQIFTDAERVIAHPVVRNRGTVGGALRQAGPSAERSAACVAIGAKMPIRTSTRERILSMGQVHRGRYRTAIGGEIACPAAEEALRDARPTGEVFAHAAQLAANACAHVSDQRGSGEYKRHVAGVLTERALRRATARAQHREEER